MSESITRLRTEDNTPTTLIANASALYDVAETLSDLERVVSGKVSLASLASKDWEGIAPYLAEQRPMETLNLALRLPSGRIAQSLCVEALRSIAKIDAARAWRELERLGPGNMEREATAAVLGAWTESNPVAAAKAASTQPEDNVDARRAVAGAWARKDPQAAVAWASQLHGEARDVALSEAVQQAMTDTSDDALSRLVSACTDVGSRAEVASVIVTSLMLEDESKAYRWARTLQGQEREIATSRLVRETANSSPEAAAKAVSELLRDTTVITTENSPLESALITVAQSFANTDAAAAMNWASSLPTSLSGDAIREAMFAWAARDPASASEWLIRQPISTSSTRARIAFASGIMDADPQSAMQWLLACPASDERDALMRIVAGSNAIASAN